MCTLPQLLHFAVKKSRGYSNRNHHQKPRSSLEQIFRFMRDIALAEGGLCVRGGRRGRGRPRTHRPAPRTRFEGDMAAQGSMTFQRLNAIPGQSFFRKNRTKRPHQLQIFKLRRLRASVSNCPKGQKFRLRLQVQLQTHLNLLRCQMQIKMKKNIQPSIFSRSFNQLSMFFGCASLPADFEFLFSTLGLPHRSLFRAATFCFSVCMSDLK